MRPSVFIRLLLLNSAVSVGVGLVLGMLVGGRMNMWAFAGLIAGLVWVASSLVTLLWHRFRREARWSYLEGLGWGLLVFLLSVVPFLLIFTGQNGRWGMGWTQWLGWAFLVSSPILLGVAPFVPWLWKRVMEGSRGEV
ncbi:MAG: hypothetical protein N2318_09970 [Meiothermus sp.]|nr:hypothetical protein [Meiothermus sp.]